MLRSTRALLIVALFALPLTAMQGTGVGTLPGRSVQRNVGWLDPWATVEIVSGSGAEFDLRSTHNAEDAVANTSPEHPSVMHASWTWHGATITLDVPRLSSEPATDEGDAHFYERVARQVSRAQIAMPPDRLVLNDWPGKQEQLHREWLRTMRGYDVEEWKIAAVDPFTHKAA